MSALLLAARSGAAKTLKLLLAGRADVNVKLGGRTALTYAAMEEHADAIEVVTRNHVLNALVTNIITNIGAGN